MTKSYRGTVAILYPGDSDARKEASPANNRFSNVFQTLADVGVEAVPAVYHDDFCDEIREQLLQVDAVLVWVNPIHDGRDRSILDAMLRKVADAGVFVSAHPDTILKMGTKEVLYQTRSMGWGCDTHLYHSMEQIRRELPGRLASGQARVLKQYRGNGGTGVWKIEMAESASASIGPRFARPEPASIVRVRHAKRGSVEEEISLEDFLGRCEPYFAGNGKVIDQAYQQRLVDGMIRCYLVGNRVAGFGHQAVNALYPAPPGRPASEAPRPSPRLYHPPSMPEFQSLKRTLEQEWVPAMQQLLDIDTEMLPVLWDCDFLLGPVDASGDDTYVLCEINISSVAPFPGSALPYIAEAMLAQLQRGSGQ